MSKYVPDIISKRWVIISPQRLSRPGHKGKAHVCPFDEGNERLTPPEILRYGKGEPNKSGWSVRVIPNKFPITDVHEVIVHSPNHELDVETLSIEHIALIFRAYRDRFNTHRKQGQVFIFCNHGAQAGASLDHPHSQLVLIPSQINLDILSREPLNNIVDENTYFHVYCPDFSQWPYEVWVAPKKEGTMFGDMTDRGIDDVSEILKRILTRLKEIYKSHRISDLPFGYNYYIHPRENWYIRITPRFVHRAGFELGTGLSVNVVDPIDAALTLKGLETKIVKVMERLKKY